jgi:ectoine hydroxylase-related dioxygenase (phytanoyl-CoA dioxygenase family)
MNKDLTLEDKLNFERDGYLVIKVLSDETCELINQEIQEKLASDSEDIKKNPSIYHYNENPRVIEAWRWSSTIKKVALDEYILSMLRGLWSAEPIPFSTINFIKGTEQPLHSDYFHFGSKPELFLAGVWIALENLVPGSGELSVVPGSHHYPIVDCGDLGLEFPKSKKELKINNSAYEEYVQKEVLRRSGEIKKLLLKQGEAVIWAANLLHGGSVITNKEATRKALVMHYHFEGCEFFYNPNFSKKIIGKYAIRKLDESDIRGNHS